MAKINFNFVDQKFISTTIKNQENGRKYIQVTCPSCGQIFDKREFYDHVLQIHGKRRDEVLSKLFGIKEYPVICSDCGKEVHFDESSGIFSRKCKLCNEKDRQLANSDNSMTLEQLLEQQKNLEIVFKAKQDALAQQIAAAKKELEWKNLDIYSTKPRFLPEAVKFVRKISYELRVHITNGMKKDAYELLNYLDDYLDNETWKEVIKND